MKVRLPIRLSTGGAEHEEHEHVAEQVQEPGMDEHVGDEGPRLAEAPGGREREGVGSAGEVKTVMQQEQHHRIRDDESPDPRGETAGGSQIHRTRL